MLSISYFIYAPCAISNGSTVLHEHTDPQVLPVADEVAARLLLARRVALLLASYKVVKYLALTKAWNMTLFLDV